MGEIGFNGRVTAVRRFNRFYTQKIGVLKEGLLGSPYSLTEVRLLYELAHGEKPTASELAKQLGLDAGYLSRILSAFKERGLIKKARSKEDGRRSLLSLSGRGKAAFAPLNARSEEEIGTMLGKLSAAEQERLVEALHTVEELLGADREQNHPFLLRPQQSGDLGWVVQRHGFLYAQEYGWDEQFEALVASIVAKFVQRYDAKRERCWVAVRGGDNVGCVFLVKKAKTVAQLRLLLVEPTARGLGIGSHLVAECIRFARQAGYRKVELWTNSVLKAARRIYERAGFHLVREHPHHSFGHDLVGQTWELTL
jgi:DNA-binding MarR family transcriptional regulator/N-acetylglutamate synthase-like GNAT family acetyltransferase